ncbi:Hypothetical protein CINCED_3A021797 [Cinara cedri]|uniref:Uncharacterized protein n=1 Tax=Cinara cedri TaxID=506608 RepID=A0A5E4N1X4_9HEMI|nr:Hypothetical protein CINCED_3A021797 [Cinara cedri]
MEDEGKAVREESARRPMILMYDVGRDIEKDRLGKLLAEQNPDLGIGEETVIPLFMKGPKTGDSVWWVCAVAPDAYQKVTTFWGGHSCLKSTSANWGIRQATSAVIYKAVFLPRITYASEVWASGVLTAKAVKLLGSKQRRALLSLTGAYRTTSTDALQVVAGQLPLDLEIRWSVVRKKRKVGLVSEEEKVDQWSRILEIWQTRWDTSEKGRWTHSMIPKVKRRLEVPLEVDHCVTQFLTGNGDFNAKLNSFALRGSGACRCGTENETVDHVLFRCPELTLVRDQLIRDIGGGVARPCSTEVFLNTRSNYRALCRFAKSAIEAKQLADRLE